ncbi:MAG: hypothetical protein A4E28_00007 [Methanocella sp. PtaU1.Bin125]|nr:MAG: hypothetical protein A4E28_00007 [Methanocella sp. PtaU1.Bin125]
MGEVKIDVADRDSRLKSLQIISDYFGGGDKNIFERTEYDEEQRKYVSLLKGLSDFMGGLPGTDACLVAHAQAGISLRRKGRIEFDDVMKAGNAGVNPTSYPHESRKIEESIIEKLKFWK